MAGKPSKGADSTAGEVRRIGRPFKSGAEWSGNRAGRPKGSRNKLEELFVSALCEDFKDNGADAIRRCRADKPDVYLNVIAKVVPKQVELDATDAAVDFAKGLHAVAEFLEGFAAGESSADHAGPVPDGPVLPVGVRAQAH